MISNKRSLRPYGPSTAVLVLSLGVTLLGDFTFMIGKASIRANRDAWHKYPE